MGDYFRSLTVVYEDSTMERLNGLEFARFLAALAVVYGHLVWSATFAPDLSVYVGAAEFPLIPPDTHSLWVLQREFGSVFFGVHITVVGVALFFLLTGWLTPDLLERNSRIGYLTNRFFRIFPALIVSTLLLAAIQYFVQAAASITPRSILGTATTTYREISSNSLNDVVWTLAIEVRFYLLCFLVGKWTSARLISVSLILLATCHMAAHAGGDLLPLAHDTSFIIFILCGIAVRQVCGMLNTWSITALIVAIAAFNMSLSLDFIFRPMQSFTVMTQLVTYAVFAFFVLTSRYIGNWIRPWSALTYSLYLLHLIIGLYIISLLRNDLGATGAVLVALSASLAVAYFFTRFIEIPGMRLGKSSCDLCNLSLVPG